MKQRLGAYWMPYRVFFGLCALALLLLSSVVTAGAVPGKPVKRISFVLDGPESIAEGFIENKGYVQLFRQELEALLQGDFEIQFPDRLIRHGDFTSAGVRQALDAAINDADTDLVITLGLLSSRQACLRKHLPKPVIAAIVLDHVHQKVPYRNGTSGVKNLSYVEIPDTFKEDLLTFLDIVPFDNLGVLGGQSMFAAIPGAGHDQKFQVDFTKAKMRLLQAGDNVAQTLASIPPDIDALYLLPIPEMSMEEHEHLLNELAVKRLPVFSLIGHPIVRRGALAGLNKSNWFNRLARRVALNARKILLGQQAAQLPVAISRQAQLMINMQTARITGVYPGFSVLTDAVLINEQPDETTRELTLLGVMDEAVLVNLELAATGRANAAGQESIQQARSRLFPQLSIQATGSIIDEDRGESNQAPAERTLDGSLNLSQVIWSDDIWANLTVEKMRQLRNTLEWEQTRLDVALDAASAYLNVLLAKTQHEILTANLRLSRSNLEQAKMRRSLGAASAAEVYRLESRIAQERADVLQAAARKEIAGIELNRLLAYRLDQPFQLADVGLDEQVSLLLSTRIRPYAENELGLRRVTQFMVTKGLRASPELMQIDADIAAEKRQLLAAKRSYYAPDINLTGQVSHLIGEDGAGADVAVAGEPDDTDWSVNLNLSLPLWEGGGRIAETRSSRETLKSLRFQRRASMQRVEQRIRNAAQEAVASYTSIELLKSGAQSSRKNFDLVTDAYSRGAVPLIDLLDAQTTYLQAELNAANANYTFLLDLMELERALGQFTFFLPQAKRNAWIHDLEAYFNDIDHKEK